MWEWMQEGFRASIGSVMISIAFLAVLGYVAGFIRGYFFYSEER